MPVIEGSIQASMVLRDTDWRESVRSNVGGTWNLHGAMPRGTLGQANYVVGNAFRNAAAYHRVVAGARAMVLTLGLSFSTLVS
ncbi:hypothetical protein PG985_014105 [Apiospora marii]|uniref:Ketoreductase (KR) domain-containing protein n=1 Tax=Apiospora marii TaxID=335849 RepID=A0ABR1R5W8_9PEZI